MKYQKYGVINRKQLLEKANLEKVEVCNKETIPYWKYDENDQLISEIYLSKKDVVTIMKYLENEQDENKLFKITYSNNGGFYQELKMEDKSFLGNIMVKFQ